MAAASPASPGPWRVIGGQLGLELTPCVVGEELSARARAECLHRSRDWWAFQAQRACLWVFESLSDGTGPGRSVWAGQVEGFDLGRTPCHEPDGDLGHLSRLRGTF